MKDNAIKVIKLNVLDSHDRLLELKKTQSDILAKGCDDCLKRNPLSLAMQKRSPYIYIFAHPRTESDGIKKKMLWQPRLLKPSPQTNSYLFRANSHSDTVEICWMIPNTEIWGQYKKGLITENPIVEWSIGMFLNNKEELSKPHPEDLSDETAKSFYIQILQEMETKRMKPILPDIKQMT